MPALSSDLRKALEDACVRGRREAEAGCRAELGRLGVVEARAPSHLRDDEKDLRRGLRAKRRQLGDEGESVELLLSECAYEQWHRLLFARFLAENRLLIHPEYRAPVSLAECAELASELDEPDAWGVAARFAAEILPGIFRLDDPCIRLRLAPESRLALEAIVEALPREVFTSDDGLGWVYQYWQREKKDEVNASERKIGGADLGPVTQLFTENYMVRFLLENSLGAWWASRRPESPLQQEWEYLRLDEDGTPAAGSFNGWPERAAEVTVMDPCCGSGHFLVEAFGMLWRMRAEEEGFTSVAAQDAVLADNLFGLELDPRCVQIAMFAVALAAWKAGGGWRELPVPHIACSGIPVKTPVEEWKALAQGDARLGQALEALHVLFADADTLGSLIDPRRAVETSEGEQVSFESVEWDEISELLETALTREAADPATAVLGADAAGIARAADFLSRSYSLACTNPPFLDHKKQDTSLARRLKVSNARTRRELAMVMFERAVALLGDNGVVATVTPALWTSAQPFERFRKDLLHGYGLELVVNLGTGAFESIGGEVVNAVLVISTHGVVTPPDTRVLDVSEASSVAGKRDGLINRSVRNVPRRVQAANPKSRFMFISTEAVSFLGDVCHASAGIQTGDNNRFHRCFWELPVDSRGWIRLQRSARETAPYSGRHLLLFWEDGSGELFQFVSERLGGATGQWIRGLDLRGREGVGVSRIGNVPATLYSGDAFADNVVVLVPKEQSDFAAVWAFCSSPEFATAVRSVDMRLSVATGTFLATPIDLEHWRVTAPPVPPPERSDPTQWLFEGRPEVSTEPLQVAIGRLLGYSWPEQPESDDLTELADRDGIVCLPSVLGERPAAERLQELLATAYGTTWSPARTRELLDAAGSKKEADLDSWLRDEFFKAHCQVFMNRPFVWHIWDGRKDGFAALVNYHRLDGGTLRRLAYTYLGDWIERQTAAFNDEEAGAEARLVAAQSLQQRLALILKGEPPYDIFVRWKPLAEQPLGWSPDLNDGVRLNIRPHVEAGVLRGRFNIHWRPDGGKVNDRHLPLEAKQSARAEAAK